MANNLYRTLRQSLESMYLSDALNEINRGLDTDNDATVDEGAYREVLRFLRDRRDVGGLGESEYRYFEEKIKMKLEMWNNRVKENQMRKYAKDRIDRDTELVSSSDMYWIGNDGNFQKMVGSSNSGPAPGSRELAEAKEALVEMQTILENIQKEPLILYQIDRMTKDKKHAFIKKGDTDMRIEGVKDLDSGDEVLCHPKTFQIVERLGRPPLVASRFAPDKIPDVKWSDIGGLEDAKADLIEAIESPHKNKELFKHYNKRPIKGILLSGPPGCGKTMLGKAAANSLAMAYGQENARTGFLYVKGPEVLNQYVGATEQTIRDMFFDAKRHREEHGYPAIIFLDEADAILASRGSRNIGIGNTVVPQFLTEMDGLEELSAIVIIATNRPDVLDPAIVRDGRIDRKVTVTRPDFFNAQKILELNLKNVPIHTDYDIKDLAEGAATMIYSDDAFVSDDILMREIVNGAMLANCVDLAVSSAIKRDMVLGEVAKYTGVMPDDIISAITRLKKQNHGLKHNIES